MSVCYRKAALGNRELLDRLLFDSAKETLLEVAADPKHLGARIGVLMVVHTWGAEAGTSVMGSRNY